MIGPVWRLFYRLSKRHSRAGLYEWLEKVLSEMNADTKGLPVRVLNVGAGGEIFDKIKTLHKADVFQIDIDPGRKPDLVADVCNLPLAEESFDAVFMLEVLEHVPTPHRALEDVHRVLKTGGRLYLSTPFIFPIHDEPHDYFRFTRYGLSYLLSGFRSVEIQERNGYVQSIMVLYARSLITDTRSGRWVGMGFFALGLALYPVFFMFSRLMSTRRATTGYVVTATR